MIKKQSKTTNIGDVVYIIAKVSAGMFPSERYFYVKTKPPIVGYVADNQVFGNAVIAVVTEVTHDGLIVALPGEASRNNLVRVPRSLVSRRVEA
jgi:hypothetical protein